MAAVSQLIGRGIGFSPGSTKYVPTLGLSPGIIAPFDPTVGPEDEWIYSAHGDEWIYSAHPDEWVY